MKLKKHKYPMDTYSKEIFRRTPHANWSVRLYMPKVGLSEAYACHTRCKAKNSRDTKERWSWFMADSDGYGDSTGTLPAECYGCNCPVPAYIQAIVRLYEYERVE